MDNRLEGEIGKHQSASIQINPRFHPALVNQSHQVSFQSLPKISLGFQKSRTPDPCWSVQIKS